MGDVIAFDPSRVRCRGCNGSGWTVTDNNPRMLAACPRCTPRVHAPIVRPVMPDDQLLGTFAWNTLTALSYGTFAMGGFALGSWTLAMSAGLGRQAPSRPFCST